MDNQYLLDLADKAAEAIRLQYKKMPSRNELGGILYYLFKHVSEEAIGNVKKEALTNPFDLPDNISQ